MIQRHAEATWEGTLREGRGTMKLQSQAFEGPFTFASRFEQGPGTNPEELIGAAHAGCFSMAFAAELERAGFPPQQVHTRATVTLERTDAGFRITRVHLETEARVPGIEASTFQEIAERAKNGCPVSNLYQGAEITLSARLLPGS